MKIFQHILWGYELSYPDDWTHRTIQDKEGFALLPEALEPGYEGPNAGYLMVKAEWNCVRKPIEPLWNSHIGLTAGMLSAKKVGSAPWRMGGASGFEAEIVMPTKSNRRLWTGILAKDLTVLHFLVTHPFDDRPWFEPFITQIISSLRFPFKVLGVGITKEGLPLPEGYVEVDPASVVNDINDPKDWRAYDGQGEAGALQAFYLREAPNYNWQVEEFVPFPSPADLGFARLQLKNEDPHAVPQRAVLGILPFGETSVSASSQAKLAVKYSS